VVGGGVKGGVDFGGGWGRGRGRVGILFAWQNTPGFTPKMSTE